MSCSHNFQSPQVHIHFIKHMMAKVEEKGLEDDHTQDGTVDLKGRPVLRSNTGRWRACSFIVGM